MDDLDDKTGSEWLYIDSLKKNISDMQKDLKALRNDLDEPQRPCRQYFVRCCFCNQ